MRLVYLVIYKKGPDDLNYDLSNSIRIQKTALSSGFFLSI